MEALRVVPVNPSEGRELTLSEALTLATTTSATTPAPADEDEDEDHTYQPALYDTALNPDEGLWLRTGWAGRG